MKKAAVLLLGLSILFTACGSKDKQADKKVEKEAKTVKLLDVKKANLSEVLLTNASAEPYVEAMHMTETGGEVEKIYRKNGEYVKAGQIVLKLKDDRIEASYKMTEADYLAKKANYERTLKFAEKEVRNALVMAEANLVNAKESLARTLRGANKEEIEQANAILESARKNYEVEKTTYERYKKIYEQKLISEIEFLKMENGYKSAESSYEQAKKQYEIVLRKADSEDIAKLKATVLNAESSYELAKKYVDSASWNYDIQNSKSAYLASEASYMTAKEDYDNLSMKAKIEGVISDLNVKEYDKLEKDINLFNVLDISKIKLEFGVPGKNLEGAKKYGLASIYIEDLNGNFEGKLYEINPAADEQTKKFMSKLSIENKENKIKKGMYAKIEMKVGEHEGIVVPKKSIVFKNLFSYIYKVQDGKAMQIKVELGTANGDMQEIISNEIKEGDKVIIEGQFLIENNDKVREVK